LKNQNNIKNAGAAQLSKLLQVNSSLVALYLESNYIGYDGKNILLKGLRFNSTLTELNLKSNEV